MILQRFPIKSTVSVGKFAVFRPVETILNWSMFGTDKQKFTKDLEKAKEKFLINSIVETKSGEVGKVVYFEELHHQCKKDILNNSWKFILVKQTIVSVRNGGPHTEVTTSYYSPFELELVNYDTTTVH